MHQWQNLYILASVIVNIIVLIDAIGSERHFNGLGQSPRDRSAGIVAIGIFAALVLWGSAAMFARWLS